MVTREVRFGAGLAGSLTLPQGDAPRAGVVLVGGSGPADRDNAGYFTPIRDHLADNGIAVLGYDKRGVGGSAGDWRAATMADLAEDALAALRFLRTQPEIPTGRTGLFGHSEGGWVVLRAATGRTDVPWVITNSTPATTPAFQERHALANVLLRTNAAEPHLVLALYDEVVDAGRRGAPFAEVGQLVADAPPAFSHFWSEVDEQTWDFLVRKQDHDPIPDTHRLRCPHLAIFGTADPLIPVVDSVRLFTDAASRPDRDPLATLTVEIFPGADHRIHTYNSARLAARYLTTLTAWIDRQA